MIAVLGAVMSDDDYKEPEEEAAPKENEVDTDVRPKLGGIEVTLVEAAGSPMIAAVQQAGDPEQIDMVFGEVHKQAMANVLLDITGRIGTRQRDASATAPTKDVRAGMALTEKALQDFKLHGVAVVDGVMPLDGELGNRALRAELTEWGEGRLQPTFQMQARQDIVGWLSQDDATGAGNATAAAMALLKGCAYELNEGLGLGLKVPQQCMCACYEGDGAHYVGECTCSPHHDLKQQGRA